MLNIENQQLNDYWRQILTRSDQNICVFAPRRSGKTTALVKLFFEISNLNSKFITTNYNSVCNIRRKITEQQITENFINLKTEIISVSSYNFNNRKKLKGGHLAEGMVIYEAEKKEIKALLQENGVEEISYDNAKIKGKKWRPKKTINGKLIKAFNIKDWIKYKSEINDKKLI